MLDLAERLAPETRVSGLLGLTAAMVGIPWFGWIRVLPTTSHAIIFRRPLSRARMLKRPELVIVGSAVASGSSYMSILPERKAEILVAVSGSVSQSISSA